MAWVLLLRLVTEGCASHLADGGDEHLLPPLGRLRERCMLAGGHEVQPVDGSRLVFRKRIKIVLQIKGFIYSACNAGISRIWLKEHKNKVAYISWTDNLCE